MAPRLAHMLLGGWALLAFAVTATLASAHAITLPGPASPSQLAQALAANRSAQEHGQFLVHHVLYLQCNCSKRILDHLLARRALPNVSEHMLLVGDDAALATRARNVGYRVELLTPRALESRYHVVAAPLLCVSAPNDALTYAGGYTLTKQGADIRDVAIITRLSAGGGVRELPLLGCAVSRSLQKMLDPFGLKY